MLFTNTTRFVLSAATLAAFLLPAASTLAGQEHDDHAKHADKHAEYVGDPYPLATDPVTGEKLTDDAITHIHEQRQMRFNSEKNLETFKAEPAKYLKAVDAKLVEMQKEHYPLKTCPVSGGELGSMGEPINLIVGNRLVKLCCAGCVGKVRENPEPIIEKLDAAVIEQQSADYPLATCPVSGDKLGGEMGEPINYVIANRLVKLCCQGCVDMVEKNPAKYLAMLDGKGKADGDHAGKADDHAGHSH